MVNQDFWGKFAPLARCAAESAAKACSAQEEYQSVIEEMKALMDSIALAATPVSADNSEGEVALHSRVTALETELRITSQCIEALATELKEVKSQERTWDFRSHEKPDFVTNSYSTGVQFTNIAEEIYATLGDLGFQSLPAVKRRIVDHVATKKESFYPAQIARELGMCSTYVAKVLRELEAGNWIKSIDNNGYRGRVLYVVKSSSSN